jgi:hypothetical protein
MNAALQWLVTLPDALTSIAGKYALSIADFAPWRFYFEPSLATAAGSGGKYPLPCGTNTVSPVFLTFSQRAILALTCHACRMKA